MRWQKLIADTLPALIIAVLVSLIPAQAGTGQEDSMASIAYNVGKLNEGSFEALGTISFDAKGSAELMLDTSTEAAKDLQCAFDKASDKQAIRVRRTKRDKDAEGNRITKFIGVTINKGEPEYPQALIDYLSSEYGYMAQIVR